MRAMRWLRTLLVGASIAWCDEVEMNAVEFKPDWESLGQYECPDWFRDAKFGIWAHWGPQSVPEFGDWYARFLYGPKPPIASDWELSNTERFYKHHLENFGHPSRHGAKDLCNEWTASKWEPQKLIDLYKRAGAKYFVSLANHHDNFDCFDSKYQPWNSVNVGPRRDVVGTWAKLAREQGMRFGVSVHASRTWAWFESSRGSDTEGPLKGVPYDGNLTRADGKGTWWDGLDPQDLYCRPHAPGAPPDAQYIEKFCNRTIDLIDSYQPDLVYFDDEHELPFGQTGLDIAAHFYNARQTVPGRTDAVLTFKRMSPEKQRAVVMDIEKGASGRIEPYPWQTCTCLGNWFYVRDYDYKSAGIVLAMLVDIVSKNGNMLLSVPMRGDGTIDDRERDILESLARWMDVNSEAIFSTRPWKVFGEGPTQPEAGPFKESNLTYTSKDFRFTTRGEILYALALAWPEDGKWTITSLREGSDLWSGSIGDVRLLGCDTPLKWRRESSGIVVEIPSQLPKPCEHVWALKITRGR